MDAAPATQERPGIWRDFGYYTAWWVLWSALSALLSPIAEPGNQYWYLKGIQIVLGVGLGIVGSALFTLFQNTANAKRVKAMSWGAAIGIWIVLRFAVAIIWA